MAANTVVLESSECKISIATNIRGINPHIQWYCNIFGIGNVMALKVIAVGHTHRQTADNLNIIVLKPICGSTEKLFPNLFVLYRKKYSGPVGLWLEKKIFWLMHDSLKKNILALKVTEKNILARLKNPGPPLEVYWSLPKEDVCRNRKKCIGQFLRK